MILSGDKKKVASMIVKRMQGSESFDDMKEDNEEQMEKASDMKAPSPEALDVNGATDTLKIALERQDTEGVLSSLKSIFSLMMRNKS